MGMQTLRSWGGVAAPSGWLRTCEHRTVLTKLLIRATPHRLDALAVAHDVYAGDDEGV
jgi:hypothetical protein